MTRCCPTCGQPILAAELALPPTKRRILDLVKRFPGISADRLRDLTWADDISGGPACRHAIYVHINQINRRLAPLGVAVRARKGGSIGYRIQRVKQ